MVGLVAKARRERRTTGTVLTVVGALGLASAGTLLGVELYRRQPPQPLTTLSVSLGLGLLTAGVLELVRCSAAERMWWLYQGKNDEELECRFRRGKR